MTVVEAAVATAAMTTLLIPIALLLRSGTETFRSSSAAESADARAQRTLERIVREISRCAVTSLGSMPQSPNWTTSLTLDDVISFDPSTGVRTTSRVQVRLEPDPSDPDDGVDNDGDGLVDEGRVVMTRDHGTVLARATVLATGVAEFLEGETANAADQNGNSLVDERGFCVERRGDALTLRLSLQVRGGDGELLTRTAECSVLPRN